MTVRYDWLITIRNITECFYDYLPKYCTNFPCQMGDWTRAIPTRPLRVLRDPLSHFSK